MRSPSLLAVQSMAILALVGITACQEPPSVRLRWAIEGKEMIDAVACSESGLLQVRARAYDGSGASNDGFVGERFFPCFPSELEDPEGMVDGPILPPGEYALELRGVDRMGNPWDEEEDPTFGEDGGSESSSCRPGSDTCRDNELVCDCLPLRVVEEADPVDLLDLVLVPPPECIDGIDNDHDGLVDGNDPACNVDFGDGTEGVPVGITELRIDLTLLDGTPSAGCNSVPLSRIRIDYQGESGSEQVFEDFCQLDRPYVISLRLPAGPATFSVVGLDNDHQPVTVSKSVDTEIAPTGGTVNATINFGANDFLEPIVEEIRATLVFVSQLGSEAENRYSCEPPTVNGVPRGGLLLIDQLSVELLNGHGGPLDTPVTLDDGIELAGATTIDCRKELVTEDLVWGSYVMVVEAHSPEGEVCFSNAQDPFLASPGDVQPILQRVYRDDGTVPDSCHDCETDEDCNNEEELQCVANVCQSTCVDDGDCDSDLLGDLGFVCVEGFCAQGG